MKVKREPLLSADKISFAYQADTVFQSVSLELKAGEILILMGPNGCGKTTLIDCLMGLKKTACGQILLRGCPLASLKYQEIARQIAYVPQNHQKAFPFTVREVVLMGRTPHIGFFSHPSAADMEAAKNAINTLEIRDLADREYTRLSGGELQLTLLARCLAQGAPVIMMDEPTSHLDFKNELLVLQAISALVQNEKKSAIIATHAPNHAFFFARENGTSVRVALMRKGEGIVGSGSPCEMLTPEKIKSIYGVEAIVTGHPEYPELKQIVPISCRDKKDIWGNDLD